MNNIIIFKIINIIIVFLFLLSYNNSKFYYDYNNITLEIINTTY